jgi:hypothetical protein
MQDGLWTKGLIVGIILVFLGSNVLSSITRNIVVEKNNHVVAYSQKLKNSDTQLIRNVYKVHFIGKFIINH